MADMDKRAAQAEMRVSELMYKYMGRYRREINFLNPYLKIKRPDNDTRKRKVIFASVCSVCAVICVLTLVTIFFLTRGLNRETALIEPRINVDEETRLTGELNTVKTHLEELTRQNLVFSEEAGEVETAHGLSASDLQMFSEAANPMVDVLSIVYISEEDKAVLECSTSAPNFPREYIRRLRSVFPEVEFTYDGYFNNTGTVSFKVVCDFSPEEDIEEDAAAEEAESAESAEPNT